MAAYRSIKILTGLMLGSAFLTGVGCAGILPPNGVIIGIFGNVLTQGSIANDPSLGQLAYLDNSATAVYHISNSTDTTLAGTPPQQATGSSLAWGVGTPPGDFSVLNFFGNQVPADPTQNFQIGTITFLNGTSNLNSLIFAATISFYDNSVSAANFLGTDNIYITTTQNLSQSISQDADYINICGNQSNICTSSVEAFESTEGGTGVTVRLTGKFVGDPQLFLNSVALAPGQSGTTNGFIGNDQPLGQTPAPEPGALAMAGLGLAAALFFRRRFAQN